MKRTLLLLMLALLTLAAMPVRPVSALGGGADDRGHAYVGLVTDFQRTCVGVALSPLAVLTSASCFTEDGQDVWVTMDATAATPEKPALVSGVWIAHPDACVGCPPGLARLAGHDVAVVILDEAILLTEYGSVPVLDDFLALEDGRPAEVVGYDVTALSMPDGLLQADFRRQVAAAALLPPGLRPDSRFRVLVDGSNGDNCFMAAGAPTLLADTHIVLGVISGPQGQGCARTAEAYALNTESVLDFLREAVEDPAGLKARHDT